MKLHCNIKLVAIFMLFTFLNLPKLHAQERGSIEGFITGTSGAVLKNVHVKLQNTRFGAFSDEQGYFVINNILQGNYILEASSIDLGTFKQPIQIAAGKTSRVDITLEKSAYALNEIVIKGDGLNKQNRAASVSTIQLKTIKDLHLSNALQILDQVPGVEIGAYNQGGVADAFMIRGFSGAGHEGQAAIEVDGVSLNEGEGNHDGYADLNLIIPLNLSKVEVYKGPSSALFGRFGMAGTLAFETRKGGNYQDLSTKAGSFETVDAQIALGKSFILKEKALKTNFAAQLYRTGGYKENSEFLKGNVNSRIAYELTENTEVAINLKAYSGKWDATGYIPSEQFHDLDRRNKQAVNAENDGGAKNFASERFDLKHKFTPNLNLLVFAYSVQQNSQRYLKFFYEPGGQAENYVVRNIYATGANLNGNHTLGSVQMNWISGVEYFNEITNYKNWSTSFRHREALNRNREFELHSFSAFAQTEFDLSRYFRPSLGLRFDNYEGNIELCDPGNPVVKNALNNYSHWSPKFGFRSSLFKNVDFKANISNGFSLPDGAFRYNQDVAVEPSEIWQYEVGIAYAFKNYIDFNITGFVLNTSKEINETAPGSGEFLNAGKTQRRGLELAINSRPLKRLNIDASLAYIKTEILSNLDSKLEGKELNSIPRSIANLSVDYTLKSGVGARLMLRDVGEYATGLENFFYYQGYTRTDGMLFYNFGGATAQKGQFFIEFNNIFNENYATYVFDNGAPEEGQSYSPSALRNFSVGVSYNF